MSALTAFQKRDIINEVFHANALPEMREKYELTLVCDACFVNGNILPDSKHDCTGKLVLARGLNTKWLVVRPITNPTFKGKFLSCKDIQGKGMCPRGKRCQFAHNNIEEDIWNAHINIRTIKKEARKRLGISDKSKPPGNPSTSVSQESSESKKAPRTRKPKPPKGPIGQPPPPQPLVSNPVGITPLFSQPPSNFAIKPVANQFSNREILQKFASSDIVAQYEVTLGCPTCYTGQANFIHSKNHKCLGNILLAKAATSSWQKIRAVVNKAHKSQFMPCLDMKNRNSCPRTHCPYAHNKIEEDFWNGHVDVDALMQELRRKSGVMSPSQIVESGDEWMSADDRSVTSHNSDVAPVKQPGIGIPMPKPYPKEPFPLRGYRHSLRCSKCVTFLNEKAGKVILRHVPNHECCESLILICPEMANHDSEWTLIRPRTSKMQVHQCCDMMDRKCLWRTDCQYAHSQEELKLWTYEKDGHFDILRFWTSQRSFSVSVQEHVRKLELPSSVHVAYVTVCRDCAAATDMLKMNVLFPSDPTPCPEGHAYNPLLLSMEEVFTNEVTSPFLLKLHKTVYPNSTGKLRCVSIRPLTFNHNRNVQFCPNLAKCKKKLACFHAHSDRELQLWYFELDMRARFADQVEDISKWQSYLRHLSANKLRKISMAASDGSGASPTADLVERNIPAPLNILTGNAPVPVDKPLTKGPHNPAGVKAAFPISPPAVPRQAFPVGGGLPQSPMRELTQSPQQQYPMMMPNPRFPPPQPMYQPNLFPAFTPTFSRFPPPHIFNNALPRANFQGGHAFVRPVPLYPLPLQQMWEQKQRLQQRQQESKSPPPPVPLPRSNSRTTPISPATSSTQLTAIVAPAPTGTLFCLTCGQFMANLQEWREHKQSKEHELHLLISRTGQWAHRSVMSKVANSSLCKDVHGTSCPAPPGCCVLPLSEYEQVEWRERLATLQVVRNVSDKPAAWDSLVSAVENLLANGQPVTSLFSLPKEVNVVESSSVYTQVASQVPCTHQWTYTILGAQGGDISRRWHAIFLLPAYFAHFHFLDGVTKKQALHMYEVNGTFLTVRVAFECEQSGYYEQWMLLSDGVVKILRRFCVHVEVPGSLKQLMGAPVDGEQEEVVRDYLSTVRKTHEKIVRAQKEWGKLQHYSSYVSPEKETTCFPLSEPNLMTFVPENGLSQNSASPRSSRLLMQQHQLLVMEEEYQWKLLLHLRDQMRIHVREHGVEVVQNLQSDNGWVAAPEEGALFLKIRLPEGCDLFQEHRDPRVYLLRHEVQMVWIKCKAPNGQELLEFECPLVGPSSCVEATDTANSSAVHIFCVLSRSAVQQLNLKLMSSTTSEIFHGIVDLFMRPGIDLQNRSPFLYLHLAVARQPHLSNGRPIVHPDTRLAKLLPSRPRFSKEHISQLLDVKLNVKQRVLLEQLLTVDYSDAHAVGLAPPPFVLRGCFGSGKTKTLGAFIRVCLKLDANSRILVCTRSNSAADLYVTREIDDYRTPTDPVDKRILRLYAGARKTNTAGRANRYALVQENHNYQKPSLAHLCSSEYRVVVVTLDCLAEVLQQDDPDGSLRKKAHFDYIVVDEAAQILEARAQIAATLADYTTRLVVAGDDMQQRPIIFSSQARVAGLSMTILDRLWVQYEQENCSARSHLHMVYRSHPLLVNFLGAAFYHGGDKLVCNVGSIFETQPPPDVPGLVMCHVFAGGGESVCRIATSGGLWNVAEALAVVHRVKHCLRVCNERATTPGNQYAEPDVCVISPFHAQVQLIRAELRKCGLRGVMVQTLNNVQGCEFRVVILSPVLTRKQLQCQQQDDTSMLEVVLDPNKDWQGMDLCHQVTLLNAAMSRAVSILEVVGDAVGLSMCGSDECNNVWAQWVRYAKENDAERTKATCPSQLCAVQWNKAVEEIATVAAWSRENPEVARVVDYSLEQWEEERRQVHLSLGFS